MPEVIVKTGTIAQYTGRLSTVNGLAFAWPLGLDLTPYLGQRIEFKDAGNKVASGYIFAPAGSDTSPVAISQVNTHLSIVAGTAFVDLLGVDLSPYADGKHQLVMTDSAGKTLRGYLKAKGTGETFGNELYANVGFETAGGGGADVFANWTETTAGTSAIVRDTADKHSGAASCRFDVDPGSDIAQVSGATIPSIAGMLTFNSMWAKTSAGQYGIAWGANAVLLLTAPIPNVWTQYTKYGTATAGSSTSGFKRYTGFSYSAWIDDVSLKQVLTPSVTGAVITSTPDGTAGDAWTGEDAGFNRNDANGYTYTILAGETLGAELTPNNNAASDSQVEANATTGYAAAGTPTTFESTGAGTPHSGSYHLHATTQVTGGQGIDQTTRNSPGGNATGKLLKSVFWMKSDGTHNVRAQVYGSGYAILCQTDFAALATYIQYVLYATGISTWVGLIVVNQGGITDLYLDASTARQVLTPGAGGVSIVSDRGGAVRNFTSIDAGFAPHNALTYTIYGQTAPVIPHRRRW